MVVFTIVFTFMMPNNRIERFPVFILCAILPWQFFSSAVMQSIQSIVGSAALIRKVYFPREVLPIAIVVSNLINFLLALPVLFVVMIVLGNPIRIWVLYLPLIIFIQFIFILGIAFIMATMNVFFRDTAMIMDVVMQALFFMTPIIYPMDILPRSREVFGYAVNVHRLIRWVNPLASIIDSYRVILHSGAPPALDFTVRTFVTALLILLFGYWIFQRNTEAFSEEL